MRKMKDSGIEWIGEIPQEWKIQPLKSLFSFGKGLPITKEDLKEKGISVISYGQIHSKSNDGVHITPDLIRYVDEEYLNTNSLSLVNENDFIFADTSEDLDGCGNCVYDNLDIQLFAGYHTIILQSHTNQSNQYFAYLFKSDAWRKQIREQVTGVKLFSISQKILKSVSVIVPPFVEQQKISAYLDSKCSVITQAVTKGIIPNRPMKDSGIEWIGEIPQEWEIIKLRYVIKKISDIDHYMPQTVDYGIPYVMIGDLSEKVTQIDFDKCKKISENDFQILSKKSKPIKNDIIFARYATIGTVCYVDVDKDFVASYACVTIQPNCDILNGLFLYYYFKSSAFFEDVTKYINSNTQSNVGMDSLYRVKLTLPSITEQQEIVNYLDEKCTAIDTLIEKKQQLLTEMENYKKAVIYEYVTGKKEV